MKFKINDWVVHKNSLHSPWYPEAVIGCVLGYRRDYREEPIVVIRFEKTLGENKELFPITLSYPEDQIMLVESIYSSVKDML